MYRYTSERAVYEPMTTVEADVLINMVKSIADAAVKLPGNGCNITIPAHSENPKELFVIRIYKGRVEGVCRSICGILKSENTPLLRLDICGRHRVHKNADGTLVRGSHWHIYREEDDNFAIADTSLDSEAFAEQVRRHFEDFGISPIPELNEQMTL